MNGASCTCGCCEGVQVATPSPVSNPPGLSALSYRAGTHGTFLETMIARLSSADYPALAGLKTRDPGDFSIALLDSWATVADILTFYQERIANEGYLRTATERLSILQMARLIGYALRPGVASSVYLAFTLSQDNSTTPPTATESTIPQGTLCQSVPLQGTTETAQFYETSEDLDARSDWNDLQPRLTQAQTITAPVDKKLFPKAVPLGTDADFIQTLYFDGASTNLAAGDRLLIVLGYAPGQQHLRTIVSVDAQAGENRTQVTLQVPLAKNLPGFYIENTETLFPNNSLASQLSDILTKFSILVGTKGEASSILMSSLLSVILQVQQIQGLASGRNFTRFGAWVGQLLDTLNLAVQKASESRDDDAKIAGAGADAPDATEAKSVVPSALANLGALLKPLALPPSLQPANSARLARSVSQTFSAQSDMAPKLLGELQSIPAAELYGAWASTEPPASSLEVDAFRVKAALFASSFPGQVTLNPNGATPPVYSTDLIPPSIRDAVGDKGRFIWLDAVYNQILEGSWVAIQFHTDDPDRSIRTTYHQVTGVETLSKATAGFTAKVTQLELDPIWDIFSKDQGQDQARKLDDFGTFLLRTTVVYAQAEELELAEAPRDSDIRGNTILLDHAYDGLESGRWIIVSGERTDIGNVTGVSASELVMVAGIQQVSVSAGSLASLQTILTLAQALAYTYDASTVTIYGNVAGATNGATIKNEVLGSGDGSQTYRQFTLKQTPVTYVPATNAAGVDSSLEVYVNNVEWEETDTLDGLGPKARNFITTIDNNAKMTGTFGDGVSNGARLPTGTGNVTATYRTGIGSQGNVDAGQISILQSRPPNVQNVINPLPATGGADADTLAQARANAPLQVMALDRLVSVQDYADFSRTFAGIGKASSTRLSNGQQMVVYVTIAGAEDIPIDVTSSLYLNLVQALLVNGDPNEPIQVAPRKLKLLVIVAQVAIQPGYIWESVSTDLRTALLAAFSFDSRDLGQPVFQSEVISAMQAVDGVSYVDLQNFGSVPEDITVAQLAGLAGSLQLPSYIEVNLARINPDPTADPASSILPAELAYLTADNPDTLILNQVTS